MEKKSLYAMISALHRELSRYGNARLCGVDVSPIQMHVLFFLRHAEDDGRDICQREIEEEISMRASSVSIMLVNLEKLGFITRRYSDGSARTKVVELTKEGRSFCEEHRLMKENSDEIIKEVLTEDEQKELSDLIAKILTNIKEKNKKGEF
ncbi:MAG: MarR family winged helix-turn-helix transcriptional regulator [Clostridia bacterium]|nr:MarR family winged helix-turn-helix transcriptional regulator [Clostridia bacterium]